MEIKTLLFILIYLIPVVSGLVYCTIMIMAHSESKKEKEPRLKQILLFYCAGVVFSCLCIFMYPRNPALFAPLSIFIYFIFLIMELYYIRRYRGKYINILKKEKKAPPAFSGKITERPFLTLPPQREETEQDAKKEKVVEEIKPKVFPELLKRPNKTVFHDYFRQNRPHLHRDLVMTDLLKPMNMGRNTFSRFVNENFGMNFNRYLGVWRLIELNRLLDDPKYARVSLVDLLPKAGFKSYNTYSRIKKEVEESGIDYSQWV